MDWNVSLVLRDDSRVVSLPPGDEHSNLVLFP